jgi:hypothetical protein
MSPDARINAGMSLPAKLQSLEALFAILSPEGRASARKRGLPRNPGGATLRPGTATPLWKRLVTQVRPLLKHRGDKAQLARLLGVHRQAVNEYFVSETRMPDAERTLLLLEWLEARKRSARPS